MTMYNTIFSTIICLKGSRKLKYLQLRQSQVPHLALKPDQIEE